MLKIKNTPRGQGGFSACALVLLCLNSFAFATPSNGPVDVGTKEAANLGRLSLPSEHFQDPDKSLLLDITNVGQRILAVGARGLIIYSDNAGESWTQAEVPVSVLLTSVQFADAKHGWAVGHSGVILQSEDGGKSWEKLLDGHQINQLMLADAQQAYDAKLRQYEEADEEQKYDLEYELEDAQFALEDAEFDLELGATKPLLDVQFIDRGLGFAVGAYGMLLETRDGGRSWQSASPRLDNLDRFHLNAIAQINQQTLIIAGEAGALFISRDLGRTWETLYGPYEGSYFGVQGIDNEDSILIYGLRGRAYLSEDLGQSWQQSTVPHLNTLVGSAQSDDGHLVLVGQSGSVVSSLDAGMTFAAVENTGLNAFTGAAFLSQKRILLIGEAGVTRVSY